MDTGRNIAPRTVSELYPSRFIHAEDLGARVWTLKISAVKVEELNLRWDGLTPTACVSFERARKELACNRTQCRQIAAIADSEDFADWVGVTVALRAAVAPNGKLTIIVEPVGGDE